MPGRFPARRSPMFDRTLWARAVAVWAWALLAGALTIQQATAQALPSAVVACMNEHDPTRRLACYDREVPRAATTPGSAIAAGTPPSATGGASAPSPAAHAASSNSSAPQPTGSPAATSASPPAPVSAASAAAATGATLAPRTPAPVPPAAASTTGAGSVAPASEVDAFGMTAQIQRKESGGTPPPRLDKLTAHITAVSQQPRGESIVTLDNGQVWEEAEATSHLPLRAGDGITIKRGMLGAFYLSSSQVLGLRVKRVR